MVDTPVHVASTMINSGLYYCNFLLYGISKNRVAYVQKVQNAVCRIVFRFDRMSHVTSYLEKLHWLPISYCTLFKNNLLIFKVINFCQPLYFSSLIKSTSLTSENRLSISSAQPRKTIGRHCLTMAAPAEWNKLSFCVRSQQTTSSFRSQLKI